ncbi:MAG: carboxypeptidase-like regulatory domain-containing protein [Gemmataceae bacterium]
MNSNALQFALLLAACLVSPASVFAHALGAEVKLLGSKIHVEAFFDDDTPARDTRCIVTDEKGKTIAEGKTDETGLWDFPLPPPGKYQLVVDAGEGHRTKRNIEVPREETSAPASVSDGPSRDEFTRMPWERLALGLAAIAVVGVALPWMLRKTRGA